MCFTFQLKSLFFFLKKKYDVVEEPDSVSKARMDVALLGVLRLCGK